MKATSLLTTLVTTLVLALCSLSATAQTTYTDAMIRYLANSPVMDLDVMHDALVPITEKVIAGKQMPEGVTAESIVERYMETQIKHDQAEIIAENIINKDDISVEEINAISDIMETPEWQTANAHLAATNVEGKAVVDVIEKATMDIILGKEPKKIEAKVAPERAQAIHRLLTTIPTAQLMTLYLDREIDSFKDMADEKVITKLKDYLHENWEALFCNISVDSLTDDDLKTIVKFSDLPAYSKMMDMVSDALKDPEKIGMVLVRKYAAWFEAQEY